MEMSRAIPQSPCGIDFISLWEYNEENIRQAVGLHTASCRYPFPRAAGYFRFGISPIGEKGERVMGFFDNMKKKKQAKALELTLEQYEEFLSLESLNISIDAYKRYITSFVGEYDLRQFLCYLHL